MPIASFRAENFRCLESVVLDTDPHYNLVYGANASGKTSLLEALAYLGRGKSFRGAPAASLVRHGAREFVLFGVVDRDGGRASRVGVRNGRDGLEVRVDGDSTGGIASLADALPLQVIDPDIHSLVSGGPEARRRYLDWIAFHVEHDYLATWRRFRRALRQRNAALRAGEALDAWTAEFIAGGERIEAARRAVLARAAAALEDYSTRLLGVPVGFAYRSGWSADKSLPEAVDESLERDRQLGSTQHGPHRGDLSLEYDERQARRLVSRGQQKLLACAMVLAAADVVQTAVGRRLLLLLDDPAAELDRDSLARLLEAVFGLQAQVIATALEAGAVRFPADPAVFHVERGRLRRV